MKLMLLKQLRLQTERMEANELQVIPEDKEDGGRLRDRRGKTDRRRLTKPDTETETQPDKDTDTER